MKESQQVMVRLSPQWRPWLQWRKWAIAMPFALAAVGGMQSVAAAATPYTPVESALEAAAPDVPTLLHQAALRYRLDEVRFRRIAWCESRFNPYAVSPGGHKGVFQFADRTWRWASAQAGFAGASPFNAVANIYSAGWLMSQPGGYAQWSCR